MIYEAEAIYFPEQEIMSLCSCCNRKFNINIQNKESEIYQIMNDRNICYHCAFWTDKIENRPNNCEIIGGVMYIANPFVHRPLHVIKGSFGKEFYIREHTERIIRTNNLWKIGKIPKRFLEYFPDTANFLSLMTYQKLVNDPHKCNAKGCWDRYHCLRYNYINEKDGPYNIIPASHKIGNEHCPSFINIKELKV